MNAVTKQHNWSTFLKLFSEQNRTRPTRIGVFEGEPGAMTEHWIENGLPLTGIDVDARGEDAPTIEIMLGDSTKIDSSHLTHTVTQIFLHPPNQTNGTASCRIRKSILSFIF